MDPTNDLGTESGADPDAALVELRDALEAAGELALDERLELLRRAEATIARSLEGLDGL